MLYTSRLSLCDHIKRTETSNVLYQAQDDIWQEEKVQQNRTKNKKKQKEEVVRGKTYWE